MLDFRYVLYVRFSHHYPVVEGDSEAPDCAPSQALKQTVWVNSD